MPILHLYVTETNRRAVSCGRPNVLPLSVRSSNELECFAMHVALCLQPFHKLKIIYIIIVQIDDEI